MKTKKYIVVSIKYQVLRGVGYALQRFLPTIFCYYAEV